VDFEYVLFRIAMRARIVDIGRYGRTGNRHHRSSSHDAGREARRNALAYMITGGVAAVVYGDPRFTRAIDLVLALDPSAAKDLASTFAGGDYYVPPLEVLQQAPMEYVILRKLEYFKMSGSDRQLRDFASMLRISGDLVDTRELDAWIERLGLRDQLRAARAF
jgi:hypothetical protein